MVTILFLVIVVVILDLFITVSDVIHFWLVIGDFIGLSFLLLDVSQFALVAVLARACLEKFFANVSVLQLAATAARTIALQEVRTHFGIAVDFDVRVGTVLVRAIAFQKVIAHWHLSAVNFMAQKTVWIVAFALQEVTARRHFLRVMNKRALVTLIALAWHTCR